MEFAVNVPASVGNSEYSTLPFADAISWGDQRSFGLEIEALADHCDTYGIDYDAIEKSWFARCIVRETEEEVAALLDEVPMFKPENLNESEHHLAGTPEQIVADIERYADIGIEGVVVEFVDFPKMEEASLFTDKVVPAFK